jgi:NADH dehydrogenase
VVDPWPHFEFLPNIHELLSAVKTPGLLRLSRQRLLQRMGHTFVQEAAADIEAQAGYVTTASGRRLPFDACVIAVGGVNNTFGLRGVEQFTLPFKSVENSAAIGQRLVDLGRSEKSLSVVIVGAGLAGVEALGEVLRRYRHRPALELHVVEGASRLVPAGPAALHDQITRRCSDWPVTFHLDARVTGVTRTQVKLASGESLRSDLTLWTGGSAPPPLLARCGLAPDARSWAPVDDCLRSRVFENVFIAGDAADLPRPPAKQAYHALAMGSCAAENAARLLRGRPLKRFRPGPEISLISLGDLETYLVLGQRLLAAGPALAPAKELLFQANMAMLDPPTGITPALDVSARYWQSLQKLALPRIWPPSSLGRLAQIRLLP